MTEHTEDKIVDIILSLIMYGFICLAIYGAARLINIGYYQMAANLFGGCLIYAIYRKARVRTLQDYEAKRKEEAEKIGAEFKEFINRFNTMASPEGTQTIKADKPTE